MEAGGRHVQAGVVVVVGEACEESEPGMSLELNVQSQSHMV